MTDSIEQYLSFANRLADISREILQKNFNNQIDIQQKPDKSPVTELDIRIEREIRSLIEKIYPEHGIIGEELGKHNEKSDFKWIIDPIDGTKLFIAGYPTFTTLIGLLYKEKPVIGVIDQPILEQRWSAISGQLTTYNNEKITINSNKSLKQANLATTSTGYFDSEQQQKFNKLSELTGNTILGGDAYAYMMLAQGRIDIVVDAGMKPYDFCALPPIIEGAGGIITDWNGNHLTCLSDGSVIAAANKKIHMEALKKLSE
ncbi:MAG: histidinol-phosphatase [Rickettsiales bacterium]